MLLCIVNAVCAFSESAVVATHRKGAETNDEGLEPKDYLSHPPCVANITVTLSYMFSTFITFFVFYFV